MKVTETRLAGVLVLEPSVFGDERGFFLESWNQRRYQEVGVAGPFVQDNLSFSEPGVLRGLHFQNPHAQGKLVSVLQGAVWDVAVDLRRGSPTFGQWMGVEISGENRRQLWVPPGFAHGFQVTGEGALFSYKCTAYYHPQSECTVRWDDPELGIEWPIRDPILSDKDREAPSLRDIPDARLFPWNPPPPMAGCEAGRPE